MFGLIYTAVSLLAATGSGIKGEWEDSVSIAEAKNKGKLTYMNHKNEIRRIDNNHLVLSGTINGDYCDYDAKTGEIIENYSKKRREERRKHDEEYKLQQRITNEWLLYREINEEKHIHLLYGLCRVHNFGDEYYASIRSDYGKSGDFNMAKRCNFSYAYTIQTAYEEYCSIVRYNNGCRVLDKIYDKNVKNYIKKVMPTKEVTFDEFKGYYWNYTIKL